MQVKTIHKRSTNETFVLVDDIVEFLLDFAATEPTDTRNRLEEAARNMEKLNEPEDTTNP